MTEHPTANQRRPLRTFGRARSGRFAEAPLDTASELRRRLQQRIRDYERQALRLAIRGRTFEADALLASATRLKVLQKPFA
jgi:hypothetical protein